MIRPSPMARSSYSWMLTPAKEFRYACTTRRESIVLGDGYSYDEAIGILGDILAGQNKDFYYMPLPSGSCS